MKHSIPASSSQQFSVYLIHSSSIPAYEYATGGPAFRFLQQVGLDEGESCQGLFDVPPPCFRKNLR